MTTITMTARYALAVQPFQSTEATRYYLNGFCVDANPRGGLRIVATDGHRLACFHDVTGKLMGSDKLIVQLDKGQLGAIKGAIRDYRNLASDAVFLLISNDTNAKGTLEVRVGERDDSAKLIASFSDVLVDGTFPDYERVVPTKYETIAPAKEPGAERLPFNKTAPFAFNAHYLIDFGKLSDSKAPIVNVVRVADHQSPHLVFVGDRSDFFGVLMPVRSNANQGAPDWYMPKPAKPAKAPASAERVAAE